MIKENDTNTLCSLWSDPWKSLSCSGCRAKRCYRVCIELSNDLRYRGESRICGGFTCLPDIKPRIFHWGRQLASVLKVRSRGAFVSKYKLALLNQRWGTKLYELNVQCFSRETSKIERRARQYVHSSSGGGDGRFGIFFSLFYSVSSTVNIHYFGHKRKSL